MSAKAREVLHPSNGAYVVYNRAQWIAFLVDLRCAVQSRGVFLSTVFVKSYLLPSTILRWRQVFFCTWKWDLWKASHMFLGSSRYHILSIFQVDEIIGGGGAKRYVCPPPNVSIAPPPIYASAWCYHRVRGCADRGRPHQVLLRKCGYPDQYNVPEVQDQTKAHPKRQYERQGYHSLICKRYTRSTAENPQQVQWSHYQRRRSWGGGGGDSRPPMKILGGGQTYRFWPPQ